MQLTKLTLQNFRSFGPNKISILLNHKLSAFIGLNSCGKTTALEALRKMFGTTASERELYREDFHVGKDEDADATVKRTLLIEAKIEFNEDEKESAPHYFNYMVVDKEGDNPYLRIRLEAYWQKSSIIDGDIDTKLYFIKVPESVEEKEDDKELCQSFQRALIQTFYVPAIRRPSEQIKYASGSILYRVLKYINIDEEFKKKFESYVDSINSLFMEEKEFNSIQITLNSFWEQFHKDERYKEAKLSFGNSDIQSILKKLEIFFSPSETFRKFGVDDLGEGYRSLFYLTLVCSLLEIENKLTSEDQPAFFQKPLLTILAIEEPENHIAPQLLGRVVKILLKIATNENSQILLSSHTPVIVKRLVPDSIIHFRINQDYQSEVNRIILPNETSEAYKYIKEAVQNYPEIYFARLVVIAEGDSEEVVFNKLMNVYKNDFDDNLISFAPLGHRFVNHIWRLLNDLHIPYITLLDLDNEREGGGWGRIKYILNQLIALGFDKKTLLKLENGEILSDESLEKMHKLDITRQTDLQRWVEFLEFYDVFFSAPLDIDFLLLENYPLIYKSIAPDKGGPRIPDKQKEEDLYKEKEAIAIHATLKSEKATAITFNADQKELMIWYNYLFLGRGKPVTHIRALSKMKDEEILKTMPEVFTKIFECISKKLNPK